MSILKSKLIYLSVYFCVDIKVDNRDREIERLNRLLDGGRSFEVVTLEGTMRNNEKVINHQNIQVNKNFKLNLVNVP